MKVDQDLDTSYILAGLLSGSESRLRIVGSGMLTCDVGLVVLSILGHAFVNTIGLADQ